jgi:hypothetical protein
MDNVYNRSLFRAKGRDARNKLARMGGIMASSTELMEAAMPPQPAPMPAPQPMMPTLMAYPQPMMPMAYPQPMAPVQQQMPAAPAPRPMPVAPAPQRPVGFEEGGDVAAAYLKYDPRLSVMSANAVDISKDPSDFLQGLKSEAAKLQPEGGVQAVESAVATLQAANATGDQETIKDAITGSVGVENTKAGLEAAAVGLTGASPKEAESLSIDELNNRIMAVAMNGSLAAPGSMAERYAKAMIFGLSQKRDTALARAAAKAGGSGISPLEPYVGAVNDMARALVTSQGLDAVEAIAQAEAALRPVYQGQGGAPTAAPASAKPTLGEFLEKAQAVNPNATVEELTAYYTQNYGG